MKPISERLREEVEEAYRKDPNYTPMIFAAGQAADTIDALVAALGLVKSMRTVDAISPAIHQFEVDKRREAWAKIDVDIDAALSLARGEAEGRT